MGYAAKVLKDSVTRNGHRLTTLEVTLPRIVLAEFNTHRMLSRNSASSRAIPVEKRIAAVRADPFVPEAFGKNQKGMQAGAALDGEADELARFEWTKASIAACNYASNLAAIGVHKQLANRLLEPFLWHTIIVSATEWDNFEALRCHGAAQPEIRKPAELMREAKAASFPRSLDFGEWHLPLVDNGEAFDLEVRGWTNEDIAMVSAMRCARVSFLNHDGTCDPNRDLERAKELRGSGHMSPFEHPARAEDVSAGVESEFIGNFRGWQQLRKSFPNEHNFALIGGAS